MKRVNKRKRELQIRFRGILLIILLAAATAGVIYYIKTRPPKEVQQGVSRIQEMESGEVSEVEETIREEAENQRRKERAEKLEEARRKQEAEKEAAKKAAEDAEAAAEKKKQEEQELLEQSVNETMAQVESGAIDVWSLFGDVFILGDSRSEPFSYYGLLDESRVFAIKGANLRKADQGVSQAEAANAQNLIFTFGLNDASGNWPTAQDYIAKYEEVIQQYRAVLPDAKIYIASVAGVTEHAINGNPTLAQIPAYNQEIRNLCDQKGYVYIECESLLTEHEDLYEPDGEHFTRALYEFWGRLMIREVLLHEGAPAPGGEVKEAAEDQEARDGEAGENAESQEAQEGEAEEPAENQEAQGGEAGENAESQEAQESEAGEPAAGQ
ncbi:MAG: hypothetical protein IJI10_02250 [Eubacterium sp.]|nr:hypothetical protein [Eubacterium sp.]